jgi:hypothetical protein
MMVTHHKEIINGALDFIKFHVLVEIIDFLRILELVVIIE